jgi:hypothetical protein
MYAFKSARREVSSGASCSSSLVFSFSDMPGFRV